MEKPDSKSELSELYAEFGPTFRAATADSPSSVKDPLISPERFIFDTRMAIGKRASAQHRVYLDQAFWIYCRKAMCGSPERLVHAAIWDRLQRGVTSGAFICPASHPILSEMLKQSDASTRYATAHVVDHLCGGAAIVSTEQLIDIELDAFFKRHGGYGLPNKPLIESVWTSPSWMVTEGGYPTSDAVDAETERVLSKAFVHFFAALPLRLIVNHLPTEHLKLVDGPDWARALNSASIAHRDEIPSFREAFKTELAGTVESCKPNLAAVVKSHFRLVMGSMSVIGEKEENEGVRRLANLIYHAIEQGKIKTELPFVFIFSSLHAATRWGQLYRPGDHWDFMHAHSALSYCDAFFTEKSLRNLLTSRLSLDLEFGCKVFSKEDEIVAYLDSML